MVERYIRHMTTPNTSPVVITDRNGKVTTVHRRNLTIAATRSEIPRMSPLRHGIASQEVQQLASSICDRATSWITYGKDSTVKGPYILIRHATEAEVKSDIGTLMMLDEFITEPTRNPNDLMEAAMLLEEMGEDPHSYITKQHADAVFLMQDALESWEMKRDNYKGGNLERRSDGREAFILYVLEDPSRVDNVVDALESGMPDLNAVMDFEKESGTVHRGISKGRL